MVETGGPALKGFEVEGEGILSWWEAIAVIYHRFVDRE